MSELDRYREALTNKDKMIDILLGLTNEFFTNPILSTILPSNQSYDGLTLFLKLVAENSVRHSVNIIFANAESEIEKIFLSSLLLRASLEKLFCFIFTDPLTSPTQEIEALREECRAAISLIQSRRQVCGDYVYQDFINYIYSCDDFNEEGKISVELH